MAKKDEEFISMLTDAILKVAEATREGKPVNRLEIEERLKQPAQIESGAASTGSVGMGFTEGIGRGMGLPMTKGAIAAEIGKAIREGFQLLSGNITKVVGDELRSTSQRSMELEHKEPLKYAKQYAAEMALAGKPLTGEQASQVYANAQYYGDKIREAENLVQKREGLLPSVAIDAMMGAEDAFLHTTKKLKKRTDKLYDNYALHED